MKKIVAILAMTFVLSSCSPKLSPDHNWGEKKWVLVEIKGMPVQLSGTDRDAHLVFSTVDKRYSGSAGCNRISGSYQLPKKDAISFGTVATTKMLCPDQAFEDQVLTALRSVNGFVAENNQLILKNGKSIVMKFR